MSLEGAPGPLRLALSHPALSADTGTAHDSTCRLDRGPRLLRAGPEALDDRELLQLLLSSFHPDAGTLAGTLLDTFRSAARVIAADPDRLRAVAGLGEPAIAALKVAEALGIRFARAAVPDRIAPNFDSYDKIVDCCRALTGHRPAEEFLLLILNNKNRLIPSERHQRGTVDYTPVYPCEICVRALQTSASALIVAHQRPNVADVDMLQHSKST